MRTLRAVTFDFWSTLVDGTGTPESAARRVVRLHKAIVGDRYARSIEELQRAFQTVIDQYDTRTGDTYEEIGPPGRWAAIARELGIPDGLIPFELVERAYEDVSLNPPPDAMPHVHEAVAAMKRMGYRLGVICNTGMTGGRTLRQVLRRHGLYDFFDATVFSDEFGFAKPSPSIFLHTLKELGDIKPSEALHVGDIEVLDVEGARRTGMFAALYAPDAPGSHGDPETQADFVVRDWRDFGDQVNRFVTPD